MSDVLDLAITIGPPPPDAGAEILGTLTLTCDALGLSPHTGDQLVAPLTGDEQKELDWYLEESWKWPYEGFAARAERIERKLPEIGKRLYSNVFGSPDAARIFLAWHLTPLAPGQRRQLSLRSELPAALRLPWELLHDEQGYLALRTRQPVSIVRRLPQAQLGGFSADFRPPLRVLLVVARPSGAGYIDPRNVASELFDELEPLVEAGSVEIEILRPPTLPALRERLTDTSRPVHVLHFDGHGHVKQAAEDHGEPCMAGGTGTLAFENDDGGLAEIEAPELAQVLQDSGVRLAVLNACQSAKGSSDDAFGSVAAALVRSGVDAVAAMSAKVLVVAAGRYVEAFYRAIAGGDPVPTAHERARQALHDEPLRHVHRRRRDEPGKPVKLGDWWLPHFYQQRPLTLTPDAPASKRAPRLPPRFTALPGDPRYGFTGRGRELLDIERALFRGKLVLLHGFGGAGKTALAVEAARWLCRTGLYQGACFVSFEHGGDARRLFATLAEHLGVNDGSFDARDTKAALARLRPVLAAQPTLLLADNLESALSGGEAALDAEERTALWDALVELAAVGKGACGVILTSRDAALGDGRLSPGKRVAHQEVRGMDPEDAYALAMRLLDDLGIERKRAPYPELRDLLVKLDHHPLAVQLVLPALKDGSVTLSTIEKDFAALLPKFADDTVAGRNRSLMASLEYSLRRLREEQRGLLVRLAPFEGGASEDDLLAITEISEEAWGKLQPALEQAALLRAERAHELWKAPFLRFHPVLAPYLRMQTGAEDDALRARYAQRYYEVAKYFYNEDNRNPQAVRALVKLEMPNLRRALDLLISAGALDDASVMATSLAMFLTIFGYRRELEQVRRQVAEATGDLGTGEILTRAEYMRESGLGRDAYERGDIRGALDRFTALLQRIEALAEGMPLGRASYEHVCVLALQGRCFKATGQPVVAEASYREAMASLEALIKSDNEKRIYTHQLGSLLADLGDVLRDQGEYAKARKSYERSLEIDKKLNDMRGQAVTLGQLGILALAERNHPEAKVRYVESIAVFKSLDEPKAEAIGWHQLGIVFQMEENWSEAERCFRESLKLEEHMDYAGGAAGSCSHLGIVTGNAGRVEEAEGWYRRALEIFEEQKHDAEVAKTLSNLAGLIAREVRAGRAPKPRLTEARALAERCLVLKRTLDASSVWIALAILANIADQEGDLAAVHRYRREEREAFAAFSGNRFNIDKRFDDLIPLLAAAVDQEDLRPSIELRFATLEASGWRIAVAIRRLWAGERDWHTLAEDLDTQDALLILRVLETLTGTLPIPDKP